MKKKSIYISMLILVGAFLIAMYVIKFWFPQEFVIVIENKQFIKIGDYINSHEWLYTLCYVITCSATYFLYICAASHRLYLKWYEILIIVITSLMIRLTGLYIDTDLRTILSMCSFFILPAIMKCDLKSLSVVYSVHSIAQFLSLKIRNLPLFFTNEPNFLSMLSMTLDCYLWLVFMYIIFNFKKEKK